ncbi:hypothetical protein CO674_35590 [Rhizobium hidalgonense]|uniref:Uncharacterized protein n=2 Tax=Rhizobium TaxID=379 RepID=Q2K2G3_RHIEC|nr:hypothetical protein RHE_PA00076 [Rhizobium etli CFN 42]PDT19010.1 hypothetical protein CO674_35590 [Rhizobium hidalgonense]
MKRFCVDVGVHADASVATQFDRDVAALPAGVRRGRRFRHGGLDRRRGLRHDHGHQCAHRLRPGGLQNTRSNAQKPRNVGTIEIDMSIYPAKHFMKIIKVVRLPGI